jgi:hypothetical protein
MKLRLNYEAFKLPAVCYGDVEVEALMIKMMTQHTIDFLNPFQNMYSGKTNW